ncbi:MAG: helix-hairpin-helix domain-containing protein [Cytophagales bacterium]|nr:helix-hairpin-helix domain-containing protein [Cytophaga sp.]
MSFSSAKDANGSGNREAKGFLLLLITLVTPFILQYGYRYLFQKEPAPSSVQITYLEEDCEPVKEYRLYADHTSNQNRPYEKAYTKTAQPNEPVNINTADSLVLEKLPGIGFKLASRIIKYRTLLGGYIKVEQLKEVYGIPVETYDLIKGKCIVSAAQVKRIPADSLWDKPYKIYHPYLSKELKAEITAVKKREDYSPVVLKAIIEKSNERLSWYVSF